MLATSGQRLALSCPALLRHPVVLLGLAATIRSMKKLLPAIITVAVVAVVAIAAAPRPPVTWSSLELAKAAAAVAHANAACGHPIRAAEAIKYAEEAAAMYERAKRAMEWEAPVVAPRTYPMEPPAAEEVPVPANEPGGIWPPLP